MKNTVVNLLHMFISRDRPDQDRIIVLDVADTRAHRPAGPLLRRVEREQRPEGISFDHLVGEHQEGWRKRQTEGLAGSHVYHQFELRR